MAQEVKEKAMQASVAEIAEKTGTLPGQVLAVLAELQIPEAHGNFDADEDTLELVEEAVAELKGTKRVALPIGRSTPRDLAFATDVPDKEVLKTLVKVARKMATLTTALDDDVAEKVVGALGYELEWTEPVEVKAKVEEQPETVGDLPKRPPVVTILGHVDHGKTSLLDYIRKTKVAAREAGGITQHIGAYQVEMEDGKITFLDTPGHAAFTQMRARGAQVTDIAILVVAADDGIMPQTKEAIAHVKSAEVPIIVAVNKIDLPAANPDRVLQQLTEHELIPEAYGGDVITANVSAETGEGIDELLEMIDLQADVMELAADPDADPEGVVVEAQLEKGRGAVATILVEKGTLTVGDIVVVGSTWGKIKALQDHTGSRIKEAGPSMPVEILGLNEPPEAGDRLEIAVNEKAARDLVEQRTQERIEREKERGKRRLSLRDLKRKLSTDQSKELNLIVKADVQGSVEAVRGLLEKIDEEEVEVKVIHTGVGSVTESDVLLAGAADAIIVGFNVKPEGKAKAEATRQKIEIRSYRIIYELIEDIEKAVKGMLEPKFEEEYQGTVEIRRRFDLSRAGIVAGCYVTEGRVHRGDGCRVTREREVVYEGKIASLRNVKQDVREMAAGQECGVKFVDWEEFEEGDVIEAFQLIQVG